MKNKLKPKVVLAILDGWGVGKKDDHNAVFTAKMPHVAALRAKYPSVDAHAAGQWVGLPAHQMGNSEVGHIHIGAGRIKLESLSLINQSITDRSFFTKQTLAEAIAFQKKHQSAFHLIGLFSDGGVHSHLNHLLATYELLVAQNVQNIYFHLIGDGRDTKPRIFLKYWKILAAKIAAHQVGEVATIAGRYYAMDRDKRFERSEQAYVNLINHEGKAFTDVSDYVQSQYDDDISDEFLTPAYNQNSPDSKIKDNDVVFFFNFRPDRAIQLSAGFTNPDYLWKPSIKPPNVYWMTMTSYSPLVHPQQVVFPPVVLQNTLGKWISHLGLKQLRIAETEKIAHVTFFFDGGFDYFKNGLASPAEITLPHAEIDLIPSPPVATYDLAPKMSAEQITDHVIEHIDTDKYDLIVLNYANCDMVGHTGVFDATVTAVQTLDNCLKRLSDACEEAEVNLIITSDHGNAEVMIDEDDQVNKKHTNNLVPLIITNPHIKLTRKDPAIAAIAPTILQLMHQPIPAEMTCESLIDKEVHNEF